MWARLPTGRGRGDAEILVLRLLRTRRNRGRYRCGIRSVIVGLGGSDLVGYQRLPSAERARDAAVVPRSPVIRRMAVSSVTSADLDQMTFRFDAVWPQIVGLARGHP